MGAAESQTHETIETETNQTETETTTETIPTQTETETETKTSYAWFWVDFENFDYQKSLNYYVYWIIHNATLEDARKKIIEDSSWVESNMEVNDLFMEKVRKMEKENGLFVDELLDDGDVYECDKEYKKQDWKVVGHTPINFEELSTAPWVYTALRFCETTDPVEKYFYGKNSAYMLIDINRESFWKSLFHYD